MEASENKAVEILASLVRGQKGTYEKIFENLFKQGYSKVRVNGKEYNLPAKIDLNKYEKHEIEVVVDSLN